MNLPDPEQVLARLREAYSADSDAQLARSLGLPQTTVANWRTRKSVPLEACIKAAAEKKLSLDYLILGVAAERAPLVPAIDLEVLSIVATHLAALRSRSFPFTGDEEWLLMAKIYNSWCDYLVKNERRGETREQALDRVKSFSQTYLLIPEEIIA